MRFYNFTLQTNDDKGRYNFHACMTIHFNKSIFEIYI